MPLELLVCLTKRCSEEAQVTALSLPEVEAWCLPSLEQSQTLAALSLERQEKAWWQAARSALEPGQPSKVQRRYWKSSIALFAFCS
jgi:hypothetical protein